jgi:CMP-N,N'-diacetyllegionaminic acid synthase
VRSLGIIPARGGSKGVHRKNIRMVGGKPLIAYSIEAARESQKLTHFVVSTEDEEIAEIAESLGAAVLHRPVALAADNTPMLPVLTHAFDVLESDISLGYQYGVILQPTAPLRRAADIDNALDLLEKSGADSVVSVYRVFDHHPSRMYRLEESKLVPCTEEPSSLLRQDLTPIYHRNGAVYAFRRALLQESNTYIGSDTRPLVMPYERSVNIDTELDLLLAEVLLSRARME